MGAKLEYHGPFDEVEVPAAGGIVVKRGEVREYDTELAKEMKKQTDNWRVPASSKEGASKSDGA
jgi:fructoselysine-6-P-deglycase FrlB-like protein